MEKQEGGSKGRETRDTDGMEEEEQMVRNR